MKVCAPVQEYIGLNSLPYGHFGSAPCFIVHDTDKGSTKSIQNTNDHHVHGSCHPLGLLESESIDAMIVSGIGKRAIQKLNAMGIRVYQSGPGTVGESVEALMRGALSEFAPAEACHGHGHEHG